MIKKIIQSLFIMTKKQIKKLIRKLGLNPTLKNDDFKGRTFIFGYGSLVGASGVNGRGMKKYYRDSDLTETYLRDYKREVNARAGLKGCSFYGISPCVGARTNGVVFEIAAEDMFRFKISEGFGIDNGRPYNLVDVTDLVEYDVGKHDRILTCVTNNKAPIKETYIADYYRGKVYDALARRSDKFKKEFTPNISAPIYYDYDEW